MERRFPRSMTVPVELAEPIPTRMSRSGIEDFAETMSVKLKLGIGTTLYVLVHKLDGRIEERVHPMHEGWAPPAIRVRPSNSFAIEIPSMISPRLQNVYVASALGHFFLHWPLVREARPDTDMMATRWPVDGYTSQDERIAMHEAIWFSHAFLMPAAAFRAATEKHGTRALATEFCVPEKSVEQRMARLGIALPETVREAFAPVA